MNAASALIRALENFIVCLEIGDFPGTLKIPSFSRIFKNIEIHQELKKPQRIPNVSENVNSDTKKQRTYKKFKNEIHY